MTRIFLLGATGYIGGEVLHALQHAHPDYEIAALVRSAEKAGRVVAAYPRVRVVSGDLDNTSLVEEEARRSDVVIHAASNKHIGSVEAIARALKGRRDAYYIQVTGASVLGGPEIDASAYGEASDKVYDDLDGAQAVRDLILAYPNRRVVDNFILKLAGSGPKTAIIFPPIIFGAGSGPGNQRSIQVPSIAKNALKDKQAAYVGQGLSRWGAIHVADLAQLFVKLVEKAAEGGNGDIWDESGLYFAESGEMSFRDIASLVANEVYKLGFTEKPDATRSITAEECDRLFFAHGAVVLGTNARGRALRARKLLGWQPVKGALEDYISETVAAEAKQFDSL
ncbi:uncharacterized protein DSM5745_09210 [Aspergillus mulundensis]|uniref:Semialdehyde dehydrogenase NAD-binding domain-containing protein n=1 Tax=Aspergillus mulundensis TaxID=1810919 RepID=A0A3D8R0I8_9EURO|nr:Uncharacterized protein DSM5745_09210 [Aspergillus mulundensis]RDW67344.1 Uncharacterized protein DSM5745_09210 [Aspergillus mulundensis]